MKKQRSVNRPKRNTRQIRIAGKMPYHRLPDRFKNYVARIRGFANR